MQSKGSSLESLALSSRACLESDRGVSGFTGWADVLVGTIKNIILYIAGMTVTTILRKKCLAVIRHALPDRFIVEKAWQYPSSRKLLHPSETVTRKRVRSPLQSLLIMVWNSTGAPASAEKEPAGGL